MVEGDEEMDCAGELPVDAVEKLDVVGMGMVDEGVGCGWEVFTSTLGS